MSIDPNLFLEARSAADQVLAAASTEQVREALLLFFDGLTTVPYVDPEMLEFDGYAVGRTRHAGIGAIIEGWVRTDPSERRIEIAAWFSYGYWGFMPVGTRGLFLLLLDATDSVPRGSQAYLGALLALYVAYGKPELPHEDRPRIKEVLLRHLDHLRHAGRYEGLVQMIAELH